MARTKKIEFTDVIGELPDITPFNCMNDLYEDDYDIFMCALGFEERCLTIPELLAKNGKFKCNQAIYFEYITNSDDNSINRPRLIESFNRFANSYDSLQCDNEQFTKMLRELLNKVSILTKKPKIVFDISSCTSKLLLYSLKVLFEFDIIFIVVYSEAAIYHPTYDEFKKESKKWSSEDSLGITKGVRKVIPSSEHPGNRKDKLPELIIAFPTFKPERTNAIIADIDESLFTKPDERIIWIIGDPHMDNETRKKRKDMLKHINKITQKFLSYEISTFDYKKTIEILERIYKDKELYFHINISSLGSKMQSLGIHIFWFVKQDISIHFSIPKEYNPNQYSEGCKATWKINFGELTKIKNILNKIGMLEIID